MPDLSLTALRITKVNKNAGNMSDLPTNQILSRETNSVIHIMQMEV